jgi:hypothetical protein
MAVEPKVSRENGENASIQGAAPLRGTNQPLGSLKFSFDRDYRDSLREQLSMSQGAIPSGLNPNSLDGITLPSDPIQAYFVAKKFTEKNTDYLKAVESGPDDPQFANIFESYKLAQA